MVKCGLFRVCKNLMYFLEKGEGYKVEIGECGEG